MLQKNYTIGLDIGTNSVGYAVINDNYKVPAKKMKVLGNTDKKTIKKNLMGVLLFDAGETAAATRLKRGTRRRYTRRRNRLRYLQEILGPELAKVDANFLHRLAESSLVTEDKEFSAYPIFGDREEELLYHKTYKTIYHLRSALANKDEKADLRLIYLALAHIIKYRGNFLIEGEIELSDTDIDKVYADFCRSFNELFDTEVLQEIEVEAIFKDKTLSKTKKAEELVKVSGVKKNQVAHQFLKMMVGNTVNFKKVFNLTEDQKLSFGTDSYEDELNDLLAKSDDRYLDVFVAAKKVYDTAILANILNTKNSVATKTIFSQLMIERFKDHQKDLKELKQLFKTYLPEKYPDFFGNSKEDGYAGYIEGKTNEENFYKHTKKILKNIPQAASVLAKIDVGNYLRKQRTFDNGVIPHQIQLKELVAIIENQGKYYPFLLENKEKIAKILTFRIPYYVGPLARGNSRFAWLKRVGKEKITPFNFENVVDLESSAEGFIERMTLNDLYLPEEKVLPKHSMLYEKFNIFNELAGIRYVTENGEMKFLDAQTKQSIFELFKQERTVKEKKVLDLLKTLMPSERVVAIKGIDNGKFNASFGTYHDLSKMGFKPEKIASESNQARWEEIIKTLTIFEDRKLIKSRLRKYDDFLNEKEIGALSKRKYTGWGRLSAKLIDGIYDKKTHQTILDFLMNEDYNQNFMQLISNDNYSFKKIIEDSQVIKEEGSLTEVIQELPGSPAIKKGILQSIEIVDELVKVMGGNPKKIVVEMARETQKTHGTTRREARIKEIIKNLNKLKLNELPKDLPSNEELSDEKVYLYCLQNGRDMYTGAPLDLDNLSQYEVDHIIPQSFLKDDSIENKVLTAKIENSRKTNGLPSVEIAKKMGAFWRSLLKVGAISEKKYRNLRRSLHGGMTEKLKETFVKRQLVETRQITKYVAQILNSRFNEEKNEDKVAIVTLKAQLTSQFRKDFELYKVREINNLHHAHDAYLNAVLATLLMTSFPELEPEFVYGKYRKTKFKGLGKATAKNNLYTNILQLLKEESAQYWDTKERDLATIKKNVYQAQVNKVRKVERQTGSFYDETVAKKSASEKLFPRKNGLDPVKYGGYQRANEGYSLLLRADMLNKRGKTKSVKTLVKIPIIESAQYLADPTEYLAKRGYYNVSEHSLLLPKFSLLENNNGLRRYLATSNEFQKANELILPKHLVRLLYWSQSKQRKEELNKHRAEFAELFTYIMDFADKYVVAPKNSEKIKNIYENNKDSSVEVLGKNFIELLKYTADGAPSDFTFFDTKIPRKRYNSAGDLLDGTLIYQSKTGLYETRIDLGAI